MKTKLKEIEGIEIFVDESGKFSAKVEGKEISKRNLRDVEKAIEEQAGAVVAYEISEYSGPRKVEIARFDGRRAREKDGRLRSEYGRDRIYILNPEQVRKVEELKKRYRSLLEEYQDYVNSLPELTAKNFSQERERQKKAKS